MKRLISIFLGVIIILSAFSLTSCSEEGALSFESENELFSAIQGTYSYEICSQKNFIVFKDNDFYEFRSYDFEQETAQALTEMVQNGSDYAAISYGDVVKSLEDKLLKEPISKTKVSEKQGKIYFNESTILVTKDGIKYKADESKSFSVNGDYYLLNKVEDSSSLNSKTFEALFVTTKDKHPIESSSFIPKTGAECAEMLKENLPYINDWPLVYDSGKFLYNNISDKFFFNNDEPMTAKYTKSGADNFPMLSYSDNYCEFYWGSDRKNVASYILSQRRISIMSKHSFSEDIYKYVDWFLGKYPFKLSGDEFFEMYKKEAKLDNFGFLCAKKVYGDVEYVMQKSKYGEVIIIITCLH